MFHMYKGLADTCVDRGPKRILREGIALDERRFEEGVYILFEKAWEYRQHSRGRLLGDVCL